MGFAARPSELLNVQLQAAKQWGDFWTGALPGTASEKPRDRRFSATEWQDDPYYRAIRDATSSPRSSFGRRPRRPPATPRTARWRGSCSTNI